MSSSHEAEQRRRRRSLGRPALLFVVQNMLDEAWCSLTFHTMGSAHREAYQALVAASSTRRADDVPRGAHRFPQMYTTSTVQVSVRVSRDGIALEQCSGVSAEPVAAFVAHLRWVADVFQRTDIAVRVINLDSTMSTALFKAWLADADEATTEPAGLDAGTSSPRHSFLGHIRAFCGRDLSSFLCAPATAVPPSQSSASTTTTRTHTAMVALSVLFCRTSSVELLGARPGDAMLRGVEKLSQLTHLTVAGQHMVQTLRPLAELRQLVNLDARGTSISDPDVKVLGALPHLERLCIEACVMLTNINALGASRSLKVLGAGQCRQLLHVARLGECGAPMADLDLSDNPLVSTAQLAQLLSSPRQDVRRLNLNGMRLPKDVYRSGALGESGLPSMPPILHHVTHLYLNGCHLTSTVSWLANASCLTAVYLNHSNVTEQHLEAVASTWHALQIISLVDCHLLRTTLVFALTLTTTLTHIHITERSLVPHHVVAQLEERCVFVQRTL